MFAVTNSTTAQLEAFARHRGLDIKIVKSPGNSGGVFFVTSKNDKLLSRWISLGWTREEAEERIRQAVAQAAA